MKPLLLPRGAPRASMFSPSVALGVLMFVVAGTAEGAERRDGLYFSADLGASFIQDTTVKSSDPFIRSGKVKFDPGVRFDAALGCQFGSLAVEVETGIVG